MSLIQNVMNVLRYTKKGQAWVWIIVAIIIAAAIIGAMFLFMQSQTHPFWEIR